MRHAALIGIVHWLASLCGWYVVGSSAQAAADGLGTAPAWLGVLDAAVSMLMFPLALLAVDLLPQIRVFSLPAFAGLACVTAINSVVVVGSGWLVYRRLVRN